MESDGWIRDGPYLTRMFEGWRAELLVGVDELGPSCGPCDLTMTDVGGDRYYGTVCTIAILESCLRNLARQGEKFLPLTSWILISDLNEVELKKSLDEMIRLNMVPTSMVRLPPSGG